ncbi:MAG: tRNA 2-thiouridine(34) synthase MnmA [Verrucomicrobia bacterium]|nr:tRNA 2-thiouridine(34) synthase MnmA [Verrucomicrobiota bacterium]
MRIAALVSGGVDSSVAMRLLLQAGHRDVTAFYLKVWLEDELAQLGHCPWEEDLRFARAACEQAGVPLRVVSLQSEYFDRVVEYALAELRAGRTPSPDIFCNQQIKFGAFFDRVSEPFDKVASGHYAQVHEDGSAYKLFRSPDPVKDQTYFLSRLRQNQMARVLFPIGHLCKADVRKLAEQFDLPNKQRPDSQGICFLGKIPYNEFIRHYLGEKPGDIVEAGTRRVLGQHKGYWFHTIGQRSGLGLSAGPWYVVGKDTAANIVMVSHKEPRVEFRAIEPNWIHRPVADGEENLTCKLRHGPNLVACRVKHRADGALDVTLGQPDPGVAPGQFCVFYQGEECLGSAMITASGQRTDSCR